MLRQFIQRWRAPTKRSGDTKASAGAAAKPLAAAREMRRADWLIGGSIAALAVAFVGGLLGLRASNAELQDRSLTATRDIAALRADTAERINGIADDLAKTNRALTDLIALRGDDASKGSAARSGDGHAAAAKGAEAKPAEARAAGAKAGEAGAEDAKGGAAAAKEATPHAAAAAPAVKSSGVRLGQITVPRPPARVREPQARPSAAPPRPALARGEPRSQAEALRLRREEILRQLRLRRLARRAAGPQPL